MRRTPTFPDDMPLVIVTWGDAYANLAYYEGPEDRDTTPMLIKDLGWLCEDNGETVVLCSAISETGSKRNLSVIPNVNIVSIEEFDFT